MNRRLSISILLTLAAIVVATPTFAYTIVLADGTHIVASEIHRVEGDRVIITLPSGTETFIHLEEVDLEATREFNANNLDGAFLLDNGELRALTTDEPPPKETLRDLIASGRARTRGRDPVLRPESKPQEGPPRLASGDIDLDQVARRAYSDGEISSDLRSYFTSQGLEAQIFSGTEGRYPMIEVVTDSESTVFKTLEVAAQALPQIVDRHGSQVAGLQLLLTTARGVAAGQFLLTPEQAAKLNSGESDPAAFFVRNVQF